MAEQTRALVIVLLVLLVLLFFAFGMIWASEWLFVQIHRSTSPTAEPIWSSEGKPINCDGTLLPTGLVRLTCRGEDNCREVVALLAGVILRTSFSDESSLPTSIGMGKGRLNCQVTTVRSVGRSSGLRVANCSMLGESLSALLLASGAARLAQHGSPAWEALGKDEQDYLEELSTYDLERVERAADDSWRTTASRIEIVAWIGVLLTFIATLAAFAYTVWVNSQEERLKRSRLVSQLQHAVSELGRLKTLMQYEGAQDVLKSIKRLLLELFALDGFSLEDTRYPRLLVAVQRDLDDQSHANEKFLQLKNAIREDFSAPPEGLHISHYSYEGSYEER